MDINTVSQKLSNVNISDDNDERLKLSNPSLNSNPHQL